MRYKPKNFFFKNRFVKRHETARAKSLAAFIFWLLPVGLSKAPCHPLLSHDILLGITIAQTGAIYAVISKLLMLRFRTAVYMLEIQLTEASLASL
jgi:hypothetical protein